MSALVFPSSTDLPGLTWNRERSLIWRTDIQEAVSGKETRIRRRQFPRVRFSVKYDILRDTVSPSEVRRLVGFFNAHAGAFDSFLFTDPGFNSVTAESFGTGDGTTKSFQLLARYQNSGGPGGAEAIQNLNGSPSIYVNGVLQVGGYTLGPSGIVTFTTAPSNTYPLTWTGSFYYRVRFEDDEMSATEFMQRWWSTQEIKLLSVRL